MRFLIFNGVVIAALFYLFSADQGEIRNAADTAQSMIGKAGSAASRVVEKTRDIVTRDEQPAVERIEPRPAPESLVEAAAAEPAPPPVPEPVVRKVEPAPPLAAEPVVRKVEATPPPPPAPEFTAEAPRRLDPPHPVNGTRPETEVAAKKPTQVAAAEPAPPPELPEQFVPELKTPKVDYKAVDGRLPTTDPAVAKRQAEVLGGASATPSVKEGVAAKGSEYAIAEGETLMTPRQRRKELSHLAENMELLFLEKLGK